MYKFKHFLPFLPVEYRRRLAYEVLIAYYELQARENINEAYEPRIIFDIYEAIQEYDMRRLELTGYTNTSCNPFDTSLTPHL